MLNHCKRILVLTLIVLLLPLALPSIGRTAPLGAYEDDAIVGRWKAESGAEIRVSAAEGGGWTGMLEVAASGQCGLEGETVWTISEKTSATHYTGTSRWYQTSDCSDIGQGQTTWDLDESGSNLTRVSTDPPGTNTVTRTYTRIVNFDLSGNWDWTDTTSDGTTFQSTAVIDHDVGNGTFTWVWGNAGGNGTVSGTDWTLDYADGSGNTAHFDGTILEDGNRLEGTWNQSDGQSGTMFATRLSSPPSNDEPPQCEDPGAICGGSEDENLQGTPESEFIYGGDGNDTIDGGGGNDVIVGGTGNDVISGGTGKDKITGGAGKDRIMGEGSGGSSAQPVRAHQAEGSADQLSGGGGADTVLGQAGNDKLNGDVGNDTLKGGAGVNDFNGGPGDDTCVLNNEKDATRSCEHKKRNFKRNFFPAKLPA